MKVLLTDYLSVVTSAPSGIKRTRELVLQLAVMGKLVPQHSDDEPARELLKRIRQSIRIEVTGKVESKGRNRRRDQVEFELPSSWCWTKLKELVLKSESGWSPSCENRRREGTEWGVLKVSAVSWGRFLPEENKALPPHLAPREECEVKAGDFLISRANTAELVARSVVVEDCPPHLMMSDKIVRLVMSEFVSCHYLHIFNSSRFARTYYENSAGGTSSSMKNVSRQQILDLSVPLPPLAEQRRICEKVDELMVLCDRLEAQQSEADAAHEILVKSLLDTLTRSHDSHGFLTSWGRIKKNFDILFATEASVVLLKQTVLELALMGKLVPQYPNDEPAKDLLKRIRDERKALGVLKRPSGRIAAEGSEPFPIPKTWQWATLGDTVLSSEAGWSPACEQRPCIAGEWGVLKVSAVSGDQFKPEENKALPSTLEPRPSLEVRPQEFLIARASGSAQLVAKSVIVNECPPRLMLSDKIVRLRFSKFVNSKYLNLYNNSTFGRDYYERALSATTTMKNVSREQILNMPIALPPLSEQDRIVAKIDEVMAICDELIEQFVAANGKKIALLDCVIANG
ncbi:MAG TPA: restriction endonuclease subunit S [Candidatus Melainabacteria bacterium]|nr:restriction endonuclease subunit S [Candidatus Melainabacteria bacterium]